MTEITHGMDVPEGTVIPDGFELGDGVRRDSRCVEKWEGCESDEYNPYCCRFPKSCSANSVRNRVYKAGILEPAKAEMRVTTDHLEMTPTAPIMEGTRVRLMGGAGAAALDWRAMFVRYVQQVIYHESYDFLDEIEWTPEEEAAVQQAAEEARRQ